MEISKNKISELTYEYIWKHTRCYKIIALNTNNNNFVVINDREKSIRTIQKKLHRFIGIYFIITLLESAWSHTNHPSKSSFNSWYLEACLYSLLASQNVGKILKTKLYRHIRILNVLKHCNDLICIKKRNHNVQSANKAYNLFLILSLCAYFFQSFCHSLEGRYCHLK